MRRAETASERTTKKIFLFGTALSSHSFFQEVNPSDSFGRKPRRRSWELSADDEHDILRIIDEIFDDL